MLKPLLAKIQWIKHKLRGRTIVFAVGEIALNATVYHIWSERNRRRFGDASSTIRHIINAIVFKIQSKTSSMLKECEDTPYNRYIM